MDRIAAGSASDRRDLFGESASRLGMNPAIVEKDFWVCWILKHLFAEPALKEQMILKGGTSLSKVFGLIYRFSEDIDLILDWRLLGYGQEGVNDPYQAIASKTKQSCYNQEMNARAVAYIRGTLLGSLRNLPLFLRDWRRWSEKSTHKNDWRDVGVGDSRWPVLLLLPWLSRSFPPQRPRFQPPNGGQLEFPGELPA